MPKDRRGAVFTCAPDGVAGSLLARYLWRRPLAASRRPNEWKDDLQRRPLSLRYGERREPRLARRGQAHPARFQLPISTLLRAQRLLDMPALPAGQQATIHVGSGRAKSSRMTRGARNARESAVAREREIGSGVDEMLKALGDRLAAFLSRDGHAHSASPPTNQEFLKRCLRRGDVMLVEGTSLISTAIKYLTQSTWSHAALCIGEQVGGKDHPEGGCMFVEADLQAGVRRVDLRAYSGYHCRICRPVGLSASEVDQVISYAIGHVGHAYDTRNIVDLARYLLPTPPVPTSWRRKMISLGSGDPNSSHLLRSRRAVL